MGVNPRLSIMMFLQYAIWGAWLPILWPFLAGYRGFSAEQIGNMFAVGAIGALLAPFIAGQIADRWFATERFLALSHVIGAGLIYKLATVDSYEGFLLYSLLYSIVYAPTLPLTNSLTLHHVKNLDRDFGKIRLWGTVGWIVVGLGVGQWLSAQWTPSTAEATAVVIEERVLDPEARRALLADSRLVLDNKDVHEGVATEQEDGSWSVVAELADPGDAWPKEGTVSLPGGQSFAMPDDDARWEEGATLRLDFEAEEVEKVSPMVAAVTEIEGEAAESEQRATLLRDTLQSLESDDGDATRDAALTRLAEAEPFNDGTLKGPISKKQDEGRADAFRLSALLGLILGVFCLLLPHTPPKRGQNDFAVTAAFAKVRVQPLLTLFCLAVPVSCIHQFYFVHTSGFLSASGIELNNSLIKGIFGVGGGGLMTLGQVTELAVLGLIPLCAGKVSRKNLLAVGLVAYGARMFLFAYPELSPLPTSLTLLLGVALHGFCFGCFIFVSFMIVEEQTSGDVRASAQSLYNLVIVGVGTIVGSKIAASVQDWATTEAGINYTRLFSVPMWASLGCLVVLLLFYPARSPVHQEPSPAE